MKSVITLCLAITLSLGFSGSVKATNGPAALWVNSASTTPTHWNVEVGTLIEAQIRGVELQPLPATIPIWIKSSYTGNIQLVGYRLVDTQDYAFSYTPPVTAAGVQGACATSIVSYGTVGHNVSNDLIDDHLLNDSSRAASGFRYMYLGGVMDCHPTPVLPHTWGQVKALYR